MLIRVFVLKVINNERKILIHLEIIDHRAKKIESVITQVCKESTLWIYPQLRWPSFSLTFSFKFACFCLVDIWTLKKDFGKENKKPFAAIKTTIKHKNLSPIYITERR